jgi:hypothetical protein
VLGKIVLNIFLGTFRGLKSDSLINTVLGPFTITIKEKDAAVFGCEINHQLLGLQSDRALDGLS